MARLIPIADWTGTKSGNVVFIHGLGGHPYDTWRRGAEDDTFWPLWLAQDVPGLAVFSYGYVSPPSEWQGEAQPIVDAALHAARVFEAHDALKEAPITLICHSQGGLIAKQMLRRWNERRNDVACGSLLARTKRVVFIATPHAGSGKANILSKVPIVRTLFRASQSTQGLALDDPALLDLGRAYKQLAEDRRQDLAHRVYYESFSTWLGKIVSAGSADPGLPNCEPVPIPDDHIGIAKPKHREDLVFKESRQDVQDLCACPAADAHALRRHNLEPFDSGGNGVGGIGWRVWQKVLGSKVSATAAPRDAESATRAIAAIDAAADALVNRGDPRSQEAFEALQRGDTAAAENLFQSVLDEKVKEGKAANREAAEAARNLAAFKRLTDVIAARDLYARAAELEPDRFWTWIDLGDMRLASGETSGALAAYLSGQAVAHKAVTANPKDVTAQHDLSISHDKIGDVRVAQGDRAGALKAYEASLAIRETLSRRDPGNSEWQRDLSLSYDRIGDVRVAQGDRAGALKAYEASLAIREPLSRRDPGNTQWQRDLSISQNKIGDVRTAQGDRAGALKAYEASLAIRETLSRRDPGNTQWQRDLSVSHNRIGDVRRVQGDLAGALKAYEADLTIAETLSRRDPGNTEWQRDLFVSHDRIGDVRTAQGDLAGALKAYEAGLAIAETLSRRDLGNTQWQRDLSYSYTLIGDVRVAQGDLPGALKAIEAGLAIAETLSRRDPGNTQWQRDLSYSYTLIGDLHEKQGKLKEALASHLASLAIDERLAALDPSNATWRSDVDISRRNVARVKAAFDKK